MFFACLPHVDKSLEKNRSHKTGLNSEELEWWLLAQNKMTESCPIVSRGFFFFGTLSSSVFNGTESPVWSTCCDRVARSLQNWGFCVRSSSITSHKGTEARTVGTRGNKKGVANVNNTAFFNLRSSVRFRNNVVYLVDASRRLSQVLACVSSQDQSTFVKWN